MEAEHQHGNHLVTMLGDALQAGPMAHAPSIHMMAAEHPTVEAIEHPLGHQEPRLQPTECQTASQQVRKHPVTVAVMPGDQKHQPTNNPPRTTTGAPINLPPTTAGALIRTMRLLPVSTCRLLLLQL
jgi:hypothetical protein